MAEHAFPEGAYVEWYDPDHQRVFRMDVSGRPSQAVSYFDPRTRDRLAVRAADGIEIETGV